MYAKVLLIVLRFNKIVVITYDTPEHLAGRLYLGPALSSLNLKILTETTTALRVVRRQRISLIIMEVCT